jgi:Uma2 family endonuclease
VRDKDEIDLTIDPPPDLAFEIDISRSSLNRMGIYAAMRVPEIWRFDGEVLRVHQLTDEGSYVEVDRSRYFPFLPLKELEAFLHRRGETDETSLVKAFRQWVREQIVRGWPAS